MRDLHPCKDIIKRYKELGGEIITVGSDAHIPNNLAAYFSQAEEVLKECGLNTILFLSIGCQYLRSYRHIDGCYQK